MVCHLLAFQQGLANGIIAQSLLEQVTRVVNGKRVALNATALAREEHLIPFSELLLTHWTDNL